MKKYEYYYSYGEISDEGPAIERAIDYYFNPLGEQGWELVNYRVITDDSIMYLSGVFKREKK